VACHDVGCRWTTAGMGHGSSCPEGPRSPRNCAPPRRRSILRERPRSGGARPCEGCQAGWVTAAMLRKVERARALANHTSGQSFALDGRFQRATNAALHGRTAVGQVWPSGREDPSGSRLTGWWARLRFGSSVVWPRTFQICRAGLYPQRRRQARFSPRRRRCASRCRPSRRLRPPSSCPRCRRPDRAPQLVLRFLRPRPPRPAPPPLRLPPPLPPLLLLPGRARLPQHRPLLRRLHGRPPRPWFNGHRWLRPCRVWNRASPSAPLWRGFSRCFRWFTWAFCFRWIDAAGNRRSGGCTIVIDRSCTAWLPR